MWLIKRYCRQELLAHLYHKQGKLDKAVEEMQKAYNNANIYHGEGQGLTERCKTALVAFQR